MEGATNAVNLVVDQKLAQAVLSRDHQAKSEELRHSISLDTLSGFACVLLPSILTMKFGRLGLRIACAMGLVILETA